MIEKRIERHFRSRDKDDKENMAFDLEYETYFNPHCDPDWTMHVHREGNSTCAFIDATREELVRLRNLINFALAHTPEEGDSPCPSNSEPQASATS